MPEIKKIKRSTEKIVLEAIVRIIGHQPSCVITDGKISSWKEEGVKPPSPSQISEEFAKIIDEEPMIYFREERDRRLSLTDWRMAPDHPISDQEKWRGYREELRKLPQLIESGQISKPFFNNDDILVFHDWPSEPT